MSGQSCRIGPQITVRGRLSGEGDLVVEGRVEGSIALTSHVSVETGAVVSADIEAQALSVSGLVKGDIETSQAVRLASQARVNGSIRSPVVVIEPGARLNGRLDMDVDLPADLPGRA